MDVEGNLLLCLTAPPEQDDIPCRTNFDRGRLFEVLRKLVREVLGANEGTKVGDNL